MSIGHGFDTNFGGVGGGGLSGLTEDEILFGKADGTVEQNPNFKWDGTRLDVRGPDNSSVIIGRNSANSITTASNIIAIGYNALRTVTTGNLRSIAIGKWALQQSTTALGNVAIGQYALSEVTISINNTAVGYQAGTAITTGGGNNVAIGRYSMAKAAFGSRTFTGKHSIAIGDKSLGAGYQNSTGSYNIGLGRGTLSAFTSGEHNTAIGANSLKFLTTGFSNVSIGQSALGALTTGEYNTAVGPYAAQNGLVGGSHNVVLGFANGRNDGDYNISIGDVAFTSAYSASNENIGIGHNSLKRISSDNNIGIGENALNCAGQLTGSGNNVAIGTSAMSVVGATTGINNIAIGQSTLTSTTSGYSNIAIGEYAGSAITTSYWNIAIGAEALGGSGAATGIMNIAIGRRAMDCGANTITGTFNTVIANNGMASGLGNITGGDNVVIGHSAGNSLRAGSNNTFIGTGNSTSTSSGNENTIIGSDCGAPTTSYGNVMIGFNVGPAGAVNNKLWIDNSNTATPLIEGDFSTNDLKINGTFEVTEGQIVNTTTSAAGNYTVLVTDFIILKTGITAAGDTVTLPAAPPTGMVFEIIDASGGASTDNITIDTAGAPNINGAATHILSTNYETVTVIFDGTNYFIR